MSDPVPVLHDLALSRSAVDRAAEHRTDPAWLAAAWTDPASRVLPVADGHVLARVREGEAPVLRLLPTAQAPAGERYLLGVDEAGTAFFAVGVDVLEAPAGGELAEVGLREVGGLLDAAQTGLLVNAVGVDNWHRTHTHCPRCGAPTTVESAGHTRRCPEDGSEHYPRTDPAVIMAVVDDADRLLLGHQARWPDRRFSTLAGFVEPGESLEQAVAREVLEEAGIRIRRSTYLGSQPWPFPSSLMLGFVAEAETTDIVTDDVEIVEAHWYSRAELTAAVVGREVLLPPPVSIARRLVEHWYGGPLPDAGGAWR